MELCEVASNTDCHITAFTCIRSYLLRSQSLAQLVYSWPLILQIHTFPTIYEYSSPSYGSFVCLPASLNHLLLFVELVRDFGFVCNIHIVHITYIYIVTIFRIGNFFKSCFLCDNIRHFIYEAFYIKIIIVMEIIHHFYTKGEGYIVLEDLMC